MSAVTVPSLLPPNSTPLERRFVQADGRFDHPQHVRGLWNADTCPPGALTFLAWALSVDEWDETWPVDRKREVIREAREIHRRKGTPSAVRRALASVGHPDAILHERSGHLPCDGSVACDGSRRCDDEWATFRINLLRPVTVPGAFRIKRMLGSTKRNAVHLESIDFSASAFRCDGTIRCDGSVSCGTVDTTIS